MPLLNGWVRLQESQEGCERLPSSLWAWLSLRKAEPSHIGAPHVTLTLCLHPS